MQDESRSKNAPGSWQSPMPTDRNGTQSASSGSGRPVTRRRALAFGVSAFALALFSGSAWALVNYANPSWNFWARPDIHYLSENSNLFKPGDRPRSDSVATCTYVNTYYTNGRSRSYWGTDCGLSYYGEDQCDWPLRDHAFGQDAFSQSEVESGSWSDRWWDPATGTYLANNEDGCGVSGYGAHHVVSFAVWYIGSFGGIIPQDTGSWNLHNHSGIDFSCYGYYASTEYYGGYLPPDECCTYEGQTARVRVTCFHTWTTYADNGEDVILHSSLYVFLYADEAGASQGLTIDNYAGVSFTSVLMASVSCEANIEGMREVTRATLNNLMRALVRKPPDSAVVEDLAEKASVGDISLPDAVETLLAQYEAAPLSEEETLEAVRRALIQHELDAGQAATYEALLAANGLPHGVRLILERERDAGTLSYPLARTGCTFRMLQEDAEGRTHTFTCNRDGWGRTPHGYNYGTYQGQLSLDTAKWHVEGGDVGTVTIPDNAGGRIIPLGFVVRPSAYPEEVAYVTIYYLADAQNCAVLGNADALRYTDTCPLGAVYETSVAARAASQRAHCSSWDGWYTDPACTQAYVPQALEVDLTLYCKNRVAVAWQPTEDAEHLESSVDGRLYTDYIDGQLSGETSIHDTLSLLGEAALDWGAYYEVPALPTLYWEKGDAVRSSAGVAYADVSAQTPAKSRRLTQDTTLYGDWQAGVYDGVRVS